MSLCIVKYNTHKKHKFHIPIIVRKITILVTYFVIKNIEFHKLV